MKHQPFSTKLYVVMGVLLLAAVAVGGIGLVGLARTNAGLETVYSHRVIPLKQLKQIADAYAVAVIDAANKANAGVFTAEEALTSVTAARDVIATNWKAYRTLPLAPDEAKLAREADQLFQPADAAVADLTARLSGQ